MELVFNELSLSTEQIPEFASVALMSSFLRTYSEIVSSNPCFSRSIVTPVDLNTVELSSGYYTAQWRNSKYVDRDEKRRFLGLLERQILAIPDTEDYQCVSLQNHSGNGLLIAYEKQQPLISIPSTDEWKTHKMNCTLFSLESGTEKSICLINFFCSESISVHQSWIKDEIEKEQYSIGTAEAFIEKKGSLFPSLVFIKNAIDQIKDQIQPVNIPTIVEKLMILENYFRTWDGKVFDLSAFPPRFVSPESPVTLDRYKAEHTFMIDGIPQLVSFHVRYTGGSIPGRIYIYPDHVQKKCFICSMHTKLPTVSDPKFK